MSISRFEELVASFARLPGVGKKSAQKYAYFVALGDPFFGQNLAHQIEEAVRFLHSCERCGFIAEGEICEICADELRNHDLLCVVESCGEITEKELAVLANGCLTAAHATQFVAYVRQVRQAYSITKILNGDQRWPDKPEERDVLYFLAQSFRAKLLKELPRNRGKLTASTKALSLRAKELLVDLANISLEIAQMAVTPENGDTLPAWFIVEASKDIPALTRKKLG